MSETIQDAYQAVISDLFDKGGPAFPSDMNGMSFVGMTLRDWFAGQALTIVAPIILDLVGTNGLDNDKVVFNTTAVKAYELADAMLAERNKK